MWNVAVECGDGIGSLQDLGFGTEENRTGEGAGGPSPAEGAGGAQSGEKEAQGGLSHSLQLSDRWWSVSSPK